VKLPLPLVNMIFFPSGDQSGEVRFPNGPAARISDGSPPSLLIRRKVARPACAT
jgi:hypothetical protein